MLRGLNSQFYLLQSAGHCRMLQKNMKRAVLHRNMYCTTNSLWFALSNHYCTKNVASVPTPGLFTPVRSPPPQPTACWITQIGGSCSAASSCRQLACAVHSAQVLISLQVKRMSADTTLRFTPVAAAAQTTGGPSAL